MPKSRHAHLYRRVRLKDAYIMKCQKLGCTHYEHMNSKFSVPILIGRLSTCNRCKEPFVLDKRALQMEKPCCIDCVKHKKETKEKVKSAEQFFEELEKSVANDIKN